MEKLNIAIICLILGIFFDRILGIFFGKSAAKFGEEIKKRPNKRPIIL